MTTRPKRWYRKWNLDITKEEVISIIAGNSAPEKYDQCRFDGPYTPADSELLNGKTLVLCCGDKKYSLRIINGKSVAFAENGSEETLCYAHVKTMDETVFFINHLAPGSDTARQVTSIIDMETGCVTVCDAKIGTENSNRDVYREFHFGHLEGTTPKAEDMHHFTDELVGKAAIWDYGDGGPEVKHIYNSNLWYTYAMNVPSGTWMATNPADYVKIKGNMYIFSFVEERQPGLQMLLLIDFDKMHDVGCCFGVGEDHITSACVGAIGKYAELTTIF